MHGTLVFAEKRRGIPSLARGWRTPDPSPTREAAELPACASKTCIEIFDSTSGPRRAAWSDMRTPSPSPEGRKDSSKFSTTTGDNNSDYSTCASPYKEYTMKSLQASASEDEECLLPDSYFQCTDNLWARCYSDQDNVETPRGHTSPEPVATDVKATMQFSRPPGVFMYPTLPTCKGDDSTSRFSEEELPIRATPLPIGNVVPARPQASLPAPTPVVDNAPLSVPPPPPPYIPQISNGVNPGLLEADIKPVLRKVSLSDCLDAPASPTRSVDKARKRRPGKGEGPRKSCTVSKGSVGHPHTCAAACKYTWKARGCKDGMDCTRCHLCK